MQPPRLQGFNLGLETRNPLAQKLHQDANASGVARDQVRDVVGLPCGEGGQSIHAVATVERSRHFGQRDARAVAVFVVAHRRDLSSVNIRASTGSATST